MLHLNFYQAQIWVRRYWFHTAIVSLFLFLLLRRDLSFQISFKQPIEPIQLASANAPNAIQPEIAAAKIGTSTSVSTYTDGLSAAAKHNFIKRFLSIAQQESEKFHIPTSIILAQAIVQTQAGTNPLAQKGNNFFKLRAGKAWKGGTYHAKTGEYRAYTSGWTSFRDHSEFITTGNFATLARLGSTDYKAWAQGLESAGYNAQNGLAAALIGTIESNGLAQYDK
jgi:flagellum-specific peptidoglycan hydrolase FlgJ